MGYPNLKHYAIFLLNHLDDLVIEQINSAKNKKIPLLDSFSNFTEKDFFDYVSLEFKEFLTSFVEERAIDAFHESNRKWLGGENPEFSFVSLELDDILLIQKVRKEIFFNWLKKYTREINLYEKLILEIEDFFNLTIGISINSYVSYQSVLLKNEMELNEAVLNASHNSVVALSAIRDEKRKIVDFEYVLLNDAAASLLNRSKKDMVGKRLLNEFPAVKNEGVFDLYVNTVEKGEMFNKDFYYPYEGFSHWLSQTGVKWKDGIVVTTIDISPLKKSEENLIATNNKLIISQKMLQESNTDLEAQIEKRTLDLKEMANNLQKSENQLRVITNIIPAYIAYFDKDLVCRFYNFYYKSLYSSENLIENSNKILGQEINDMLRENIQAVLKGETVNFDTFLEIGDNKTIEATVDLIPFRNEAGAVIGFVLMAIDQTERLRFERQLEHKNLELIKINADLDNFIYTASHDLKAPISNIEGLIHVLNSFVSEANSPQEKITPILQMMGTSINKFKSTINDLTEISKVQKNIYEEDEEVDFKKELQDIKETLADLLASTKSTVKLDIGEVKGFKFPRKNIKSILLNLITNAIKYRKANELPVVDIKVEKKGQNLEISVKDNGMGISPGNIDKIFLMFKRLHTHVEGTGIGLYIVK